MELSFDESLASPYHPNSQIARILTENWISKYMYCPRCGCLHIQHFENNRPVADFFCPSCHNEYELKSKNGALGSKINDGAYKTMLQRITSNQNPDFLFMSYSKEKMQVRDLVFIPKHFLVPAIIEKRNPLPSTARRAGWVGCNILFDKIPIQGRISIISNGIILDKQDVIDKVNNVQSLEIKNINSRGWLLDVLNCVNRLKGYEFSLSDIYSFEAELQVKYPQNSHIKAKIRQQLQILRDKGFIDFLGNGNYKKKI